jgi:hypothetical protein
LPDSKPSTKISAITDTVTAAESLRPSSSVTV